MDISLRRTREQGGRQVWIAAAFIALAGATAYWNSFDGPFIFDDPSSILNNPTVRDLGRLDHVLNPPGGGKTVSGRPVLNLTVAINYALAEKTPAGLPTVQVFHVTNLVIHILAGLALFGVIRRTLLLPRMPPRLARVSTPLALAATAIWLVHPLQTEAVTYVIQRAESLVTLFYLLTLYCTIRLATQRRSGPWCSCAVAACLLGMASKEVCVSAPLLVLLYDRAFLAGSFQEAWRRRWRLYVPLAATWLPLLYLVASTGQRGGTAGFGTKSTPWEYACTQFGVIVHYLKLTFWPDRLTLDYSWPVARSLWQILPPAIGVLALLAGTVWALFRRPKWALPAALFFLALAPTSSIVPIDDLAFEHRMYLPLAGLVTLIVIGGYVLLERLQGWLNVPEGKASAARTVACVVVVALAATLVGRTRVRNLDYRTKLTIWQDSAAKSPHSARSHFSVGGALGEIADAIQRMVEERKALAGQMHGMGQEASARTAKKEAKDWLEKARAALREAEKFNLRAVELAPKNTEARENLAHTYVRLAQVTLADQDPQDPSRENMLVYLGWLEKAAQQYSEVLVIAPGHREAREKLAIAQKNAAIVRKHLGSDRP